MLEIELESLRKIQDDSLSLESERYLRKAVINHFHIVAKKIIWICLQEESGYIERIFYLNG